MRGSNGQDGSTPYCRCRVLYLGSSVPHASKEGLLGVQEPLRELYPEQGVHGARGIDSWLSVWSNGLLLENVDEQRKKVTRFFPIESLHYCAAVRYVKAGSSSDASATRFFPLDSPFARGGPASSQPPLFAAVLRRTTGIKVLECHAFICKRDMAANALVRCCFHAYADSRFAKGLEPPTSATPTPGQQNGTLMATSSPIVNGNGHLNGNGSLYHTLGGSSTTLAESHNGHTNGNGSPVSTKLDLGSNDDSGSLYNGDENHKVWARGRDDIDALYQEHGTMRSSKGSRPRQLIAPPPPPPPPPPPSGSLMGPDEHQVNGMMNGGSINRKKPPKKPKKSKKIDEMQQQHLYSNGHGPMMHPHHHTLGHPVRPATAFHHHHHHPHPGLPPPGSSRSVSGTLARPAPVLLVPAATLPRKMHQRGIRPIPAAAPIVPIYAPLPMYPTGYGTTGNRSRRQHHHLHQGLPDQALMDHGSNLGLMHNRRMAASHADLTAPTPGPPMNGSDQQRSGADSPDNDSRFGTGIYRRKGHLNERAFSYSIRAEHRSRSHGSLASLGFAGTPVNGNGPPKEIDKKDREIAQMVSGLSIDDSASQSGMMIDPRGHPFKNGNAAHYHPQPLPRPRR
ncbi:hypothetical protein QAD02_014876 [Eretmocerus hayati]|uniref:Uncharacterized protein n=1 Tax=Eretmocerus hayati TaxID=131215 RepID=A0ACC2P679_9HYME|nr:hypothetical protein QAD02_014876 [Eretmocerus hayati]